MLDALGDLQVDCVSSGEDITTGDGAEAWQKLVQRHERRTHQRAANQLEQFLYADLSRDVEDKTLFWELMLESYGKVFAEDLRIGIWQRSGKCHRDIHDHSHGAGTLGRLPPRVDDVNVSPHSICGIVTNADGHRSLLTWQGQEGQGKKANAIVLFRARSAASLFTRQV